MILAKEFPKISFWVMLVSKVGTW